MKIIAERLEVEDRLRQIGLSHDELREAVLAGELGRSACTPLDPIATPGTEAWRWATRTLRELKVRNGWRPLDKKNLPLIVDPVSGVAVAVSSASLGTGKKTGQPTTKNSKGSMVHGIVREHRQQLLLPGMESNRHVVATPDQVELIVWFLLVHFDGENTAYSELSVPVAIDENGFIDEWRERILLDPIDLNDLPRPLDQDDEPEDVEVRVRRK